MYTCISFLAIFSLAEESKSYRLDNMNKSYDDDTGNNKSTNKQKQTTFKVCWRGLGVKCVCVWGSKFGTYSILHMFLSCNCAKIFYCSFLQHSCELSLRMVLVSVDR